MARKYRVLGFYWHKSYREGAKEDPRGLFAGYPVNFFVPLTHFSGEVELQGAETLASDGPITFTGTIVDRFGSATINGSRQGDLLGFTKEYDSKALARGGASYPITYQLHGWHNRDGRSGQEWGEWVGTWKFDPQERDRTQGEAVCAFEPLPEEAGDLPAD